MPVCATTSAEARAYEALIKHAKGCKLCQANGRDLCRGYVKLFRKWNALNRP